MNSGLPADLPVYLYIRMSTEEQMQGDSLRRQDEGGRAYVAKHGLTLSEDHILKDIGLSAFDGTNVAKGKLGEFLHKAEANHFTNGAILLVESLDRISRQDIVSGVDILVTLLKRGVRVVTFSDERIYSPQNDMVAMLVSILSLSRANEESVVKSKRVAAAWVHKRQNARTKVLTARCPSWLSVKADRSGFDLVEQHASTLKRIFAEAASGFGSYAIAKRLNHEKVETFGRSQHWSKSTIEKLLSSRSAVGEFQPHCKPKRGRRTQFGAPILDYYPRIIEDDVFAAIQHGRKIRKISGSGRKSRHSRNMFSGLLVCNECNSKLHFEHKGGTNSKALFLVCCGRKIGQCTAKPWKYDLFERAFLKHVRELDLAALFQHGEHELSSLRHHESEVQKKIADLRGQMEGITKLATGADNIPYLQSRMIELSAELEDNEDALRNMIERRSELQRQSIAARQIEASKAIETIRMADDQDIELRTKVASHIRSIVEKVYVHPQLNDPKITTFWSSKKVTEVEILEADKLSKDWQPMFDVKIQGADEKRYAFQLLSI